MSSRILCIGRKTNTKGPRIYGTWRTICERLGAELIDIVPLPVDNDMYLRGEREKCRYRLDL